MTTPNEPDARRRRGQRTRDSILATASAIASVDGLDGLTIGRLATELQMSKSGLFAHFGSKEELQLATVAAARETFARHVVAPSQEAVPGLPQLRALTAAWLAYLGDGTFPGGCFFAAARAEFDSRPAGPVREAVEQDLADWDRLLKRAIRAAQHAGHLDSALDVSQLVFEIDALGASANLRFQLHGDRDALARAEAAIEARLRAASTT